MNPTFICLRALNSLKSAVGLTENPIQGFQACTLSAILVCQKTYYIHLKMAGIFSSSKWIHLRNPMPFRGTFMKQGILEFFDFRFKSIVLA